MPTAMDIKHQKDTAITEKQIEKAYNSDITIIYSDGDEREAFDFKEHLSTHVLESQSTLKISIILFDVSKTESLQKAFDNSRYIFLFLTRTFCEESWPKLSQESFISDALYNKSGCDIVPIFTVNRKNANFKIPLGLNILKGLRYCDRDDFYKASVIKLLCH